MATCGLVSSHVWSQTWPRPPGASPAAVPETGMAGSAGVTSPLDWIREAAATREDAGLTRRLTTTKSGDGLDLAGNDYLGLRTHPAVIAGAVAAAETYGGGAGASRLVTGTLDVHDELEAALAALTGAPSALALSSGYAANLAVLTHAGRRRHPRRQRRARPREPHRRLPAVAGRRLGRAAQRPRARRRAARPAREPPGRRRRRVDLLGARRRRPDRGPHRAHRRGRRDPRRRRGARARGRRPPRWRPRRRCRTGPGRARRRHRHPVEVPCGTGRCGARVARRARAPGQHRPPVHLRHRPRARIRRCRAGRPGRAPRPPRAHRPGARQRRPARRGLRRPGPCRCRDVGVGCRARTRRSRRSSGRGRTASGSGASDRRRRPTARRGCASPPTPTTPSTTSTGRARCSPSSPAPRG